jgi:hypothetical protein
MPSAKNQQRKKETSTRRVAARRPIDAARLEEFATLGVQAREAIATNHDQAVVDALGKALNLLATHGESTLSVAQFERHSGFHLADALHEFVTSVLNLEKWQLGLTIVDRLDAKGMLTGVTDVNLDRAELLCRMGRSEEAERLLLGELEARPEATAVYVALADLNFHWQTLIEDRDLAAAESWLYRAYDLGLSKGGDDDARDLIEHLADTCLERLQTQAEDKLHALLCREGLGWRTLADLRSSVWQEGPASPVLRHLAQLLGHGVNDNEREKRLQTLFSCYEQLPQDVLGGYSAFERTEFMAPGRLELRLMQELTDAFVRLSGRTLDPSALISEDFHRFQQRFLEQNDPLTGRRRGVVIADERAETRRQYEEGERPWLGFLRFRPNGVRS